MTGPTQPSDGGSAAIDDVELMRYLDGELEQSARERLAGAIDADEEARAKLVGLELVGDLVRDAVATETRADGLAAAVMAQLDLEAGDGEVAPTALTDAVPGAHVGGGSAASHTHSSLARPANDNARLIYGVAALAAAVAAGMFLWARAEPGAPTAHLRRPAPTALAEAEPPTASAVRPGAGTQPAEAVDDDEAAGVEIAAVDFGAQSGTVFYVSGGRSAAGSTAVVWVTDAGD